MVGHMNDITVKQIESNQVKGTSIRVLVSPKEGWDGYVMRVLDVEKDGFTLKHSHAWPHINYVIEGQGELMIDGVLHPLKPGSYAYVPGNTLHQFRNVGEKTLKFICIVPEEGHQY